MAAPDIIKNMYPRGCRVELIWMQDDAAPPPGTRGTVIYVDDIGTVHVRWDNGSTLGVVHGHDKCRKIS